MKVEDCLVRINPVITDHHHRLRGFVESAYCAFTKDPLNKTFLFSLVDFSCISECLSLIGITRANLANPSPNHPPCPAVQVSTIVELENARRKSSLTKKLTTQWISILCSVEQTSQLQHTVEKVFTKYRSSVLGDLSILRITIRF